MYHIVEVRNNPGCVLGWYQGDHVILAMDRIIFGVKTYGVAYDIEPIEDSDPERVRKNAEAKEAFEAWLGHGLNT